MNVAERQARDMRAMLAEHGIVLDDKPRAIVKSPTVARSAEPDRERIRAILAPHAPAHQLEWLVASCPSVAHALTYQRPAHAGGSNHGR